MSSARVEREFRRLLDGGARLRVSGSLRRDPSQLFSLGYMPKHKIELFDTTFYLTNVRQNPELRFVVAYVAQPSRSSGQIRISARIFYKDLSLVWRSASHFSNTDGLWVGKGDTYSYSVGGQVYEESMEATTDLPLEIQGALESLIGWAGKVRSDERILSMIMREAPADRVRPYADFTEPRRRAAAERKNLIHGGRAIARFRRRNDPTSLHIVKGYQPDFKAGILEKSRSRSSLYGGALRRFRILSANRKIQYCFLAGPKHVWIIPPQATTTQLSSFGVRTIDVLADDDLFIPGFEYHYMDDSSGTPELYSQIPKGFAGDISQHDDAKADASAWLDQIPVIREFRRQVLRQKEQA